MPAQNLHLQPDNATGVPIHRIGAVSRLAGVPVSTLRMWESRYAAFTPGKTEGAHRLYTDDDLVRARLLRQLTEAGHSIAGIARGGVPQLQEMLAQSRGAQVRRRRVGASRLSLAVVGAALAARISSKQMAERMEGAIFEIRTVAANVDECIQRGAGTGVVDLVLARITAVQPADVDRLVELRASRRATHGVLLYGFGSQPTLKALREAGYILRREPIDDAELAELLRSVTWARAGEDDRQGGDSRAAIPPRKYTDAELAEVGARSSNMLCECPRHLSDIIAQLASFEDYSAACLNDSAEDAQVHSQLRSVAGSARALFEGALAMVLEHDIRRGSAA